MLIRGVEVFMIMGKGLTGSSYLVVLLGSSHQTRTEAPPLTKSFSSDVEAMSAGICLQPQSENL